MKGKLFFILLCSLFLTSSFSSSKKIKFKKLTIYAAKGCQTGYQFIIDQSKTNKGVYSYTYANCGTQRNDSFFRIKFPDEVKEILKKFNIARKKNLVSEHVYKIGKYTGTVRLTDSLNYYIHIKK